MRPGPFGETLDTFGSRAFAVCDHQLAHVHVARARGRRAGQGPHRRASGNCPGPLGAQIGASSDWTIRGPANLLSCPNRDAWFAYPYWLDDRAAPDFARTVDIHRKPGYDPCELFFDPDLWWPKGRAIRRLIQKKLGFRTLFDVIPLDAGLVRGSHGVPAAQAENRPILIGDGPAPSREGSIRDVARSTDCCCEPSFPN